MNYRIYVISNKPEKFPPIAKNLYPERVHYYSGNNLESFSKLVNSCIADCPTETVIIMSDKVMPSVHHIHKTLFLLEKGYAFVGLYRFAFFGFKKELMRRIGMFDERFVGGGYEDHDFVIRLIESNLSLYITTEIPYENSESSWNYNKTWDIFRSKWEVQWNLETKQPTVLNRNWLEEKYNYNLGPSVPTKFLNGVDYSYTDNIQHVGVFFGPKIGSNID